jgi:hypothetical protein
MTKRSFSYDQIVQDYLGGMTFTEIFKLRGCSLGTISRVLKINSIEIRPRVSGADHPQYKGGKYKDHDDYIIINSSKQREHRVIFEQYIQRKLYKWEHVHHIDGVKTNNEISNLIIMPTREHTRFHTFLRNCSLEITKDSLEKYCKKEDDHTYRFTKENLISLGIPNTVKLKIKKKCKIDGCDNPRYGKGLCNKHWQRKKAIDRGTWKSGKGRKSVCYFDKLG